MTLRSLLDKIYKYKAEGLLSNDSEVILHLVHKDGGRTSGTLLNIAPYGSSTVSGLDLIGDEE